MMIPCRMAYACNASKPKGVCAKIFPSHGSTSHGLRVQADLPSSIDACMCVVTPTVESSQG